MSLIENKIVSMKFDNKQFEAGARITMATLSALKSSLNMSGASKGIDDAQAAVNRFSMGGMGSAVEGISAKFLALSTVAVTALTNITNKAVDAGLSMAKSLTLDPIMEGFAEYELKMGSIQTILANTSKDYANQDLALQDVTASLDALNEYADLTIYNFADMTKNIGLFTNAGIGVKDATSMIKGFSNEAAASGTSAQGAAGAAYQLSQALSAGTIRLMDWRSLTNVGMGNKNMQEGIVQIADAMGILEEKGISSQEVLKDFNGSLEKEWLSADVMQNYLKIQAGELSDEQMRSIGLTGDQITAFKEQARVAQDAATKVRTWTQLVDTMKEAVGSSWSETFDILLGDFNEATELFTMISDKFGELIDKFGDARNKLLQGWKDGGGRTMLIDSLVNSGKALMSILTPIGQAFRDIFPPMTVSTLLSMTEALRSFTAGLIVGSETAGKLRRTFAGVFAIFGIGWEVVKGIFSAFAQLFGGIQSGAGGFLSLTAAVGDWLVAAHSAIKNGSGLSAIFGALGTVLSIPIKLFGSMAGAIGDLLTGLGQLGSTAKMVFDILATGDFKGGPFDEDSKIVDVLFKIREALVRAGEAAKEFLSTLSESFTGVDLTTLLGAGAAGGLALAIRKMLRDGIDLGFKGSEGMFDKLKGVFDSISGSFDGVTELFGSLTGALTTMQNNIKANIILKIAAAVGVLAVSMKLLSTIDAGDLGKALGAITAAMTQLLGAMAILAKISGSAGFLAIPSLATAMVSLSVAVLILSTAVKVLSELSWEELAKGLLGVGGALAILVVGALALSKIQGSVMRTALALIPLAVSMKILASAVKDFGDMSWGEMARGLVGLGGALAIIAGALRLMPKSMAATGAGLVMVSIGLNLIAAAVNSFADQSWGSMVQGMVGLAGSLLIIAGALRLMPAGLPLMGVGLTLVALAITGITAAVSTMGGMGWEELAKGLVGLGGALGILAIALTFMNGTIAGSAALILAAGAIAMLVPPILMMSALSWADLLQGLVGLAGVLTVLGLAGVLLTPLVPTLLGLGIAIGLLGVGLGAIGLGAQAFVTALSMLVSLIDKSKASLIGLMDLIPQMAAKLAEGIIAFATTIASSAGEFVGAFKDLLLALLDAIIEVAPKIGEALTTLLQTFLQIIITNAPAIGQAFTAIIQTFLQTLITNVPLIVSAIIEMMTRVLNAIAARIPDLVTAGVNVIVAFLRGIANNLPRVTDAGADLIITFVNSLANTIETKTGEMRSAGLRLATAIINGLTGGLLDAVTRVANAAANMARNALNAAKEALGINSPSKEFIKVGGFAGDGFVVGMDNSQKVVSKAAAGMGEAALYGAREGLTGVEQLFDNVGRAAQGAYDILTKGDYAGGIWAEDSPVVGGLFNLREGFDDVGSAARQVYGILTEGDFKGGVWGEDSPVVDGLFAIRENFHEVAKTADSTFSVLTRGDFKGGIFAEDSPIVDGLFKIREAFGPDIAENFQGVGNNAVQGFIDGVENGQRAFHETIANLSDGALETARRVLGIRSPSREFEKIGKYSKEGLINGTKDSNGDVKKAGANLATNLMMGFTKGIGTEMPKVLDSVFKTLESGTADAKFWGPNSPATVQLMGMHDALKDVNLQLAAFYGEVDLADPASIEEYSKKAGDSLTYLSGLFSGLKDAASTAFKMLADGEGLDAVVGNTDVLSKILNGVLSLLPGVQGAAISLGLAVVDGILSTFVGPGTTLLGIVGDFLSGAVRTVAGWFGIKLPVKEEVKKGEEAVKDFLVTVEDGHGRFQKLTEEGIKALKDTLVNLDALDDLSNQEPVIKPILDLTDFNKKKDDVLKEMHVPTGLSLGASASQASGVFRTEQERRDILADAAEVASTGGTTIEYKQYNTSPKALSSVEIYRNTKSALSLTKEALGV